MVKDITDVAIRQMQKELRHIEAQGSRELRDQRTRAIGLLRIDLIEECHRRLSRLQVLALSLAAIFRYRPTFARRRCQGQKFGEARLHERT